MERTALTPEGKEKILKEIRYRKEELRPQIIKAIAEARAHGDLSENSEYEDARERQGLNEASVKNLEAQIATSVVIDITTKEPAEGEDRKVFFGCTVILEEDDKETVWKIVGTHDAKLKDNKLSYKSPIGRGLIGKFEGDMVEIELPSRKRELYIAEVHYLDDKAFNELRKEFKQE